MSDELDVLEPAGSSIRYRGEQLEIRPLTIGQLPKLVRTARPVIDAVLALESLPDTDDNGELVTLLLDLIEKHSDQVFQAAAICTDKDPAWIEAGGIDEFAQLALKVFEVNRDFFAQKLAPLLAGRAGKFGGSGQTASNSSSSEATH